MKVSFFGSLSLLLLLPTLSYAALEHDLQSLQQHLAVLEGTLKASGDGGVQPVTVVMGKVWQENSKIVIDTAKALYDNIQLQTPDRRYVMHDTMYN